jgi:hypothetical protein
VELKYRGTLAKDKWVSLVDVASNSYDPCVLPAVAAKAASSTSTGVFRASSADSAKSGKFTLTHTVLKTLDVTKTYAMCYAETDGGNSDSTWRDSYLRFTLSKIDSISHHGAVHRTQGHIANAEKTAISYTGSLAAGSKISFVDEKITSTYNGATYQTPCMSAAVAAAAGDNVHSGPVTAGAGTKTVLLDTRALNHQKNFAMCYYDGGRWHDSGVRVTLSAMTTLTYNEDQAGTTATGQYLRVMTSTNVAPASDTFPIATNVIPQQTNRYFRYSGNLLSNGAAGVGNSIAVAKYMSLVDASANSNNPCSDSSVAAAATSTTRSGPIQADAATRNVKIPQSGGQFLKKGTLFAVCYAMPTASTSGAGTKTDTTWRDSYIRLKVSAIASVMSYDISHVTEGMVASKPKLTFITTANRFLATGKIAMVDASLNAQQPCTGSHAARAPALSPSGASQGSLKQYSGVSTHNTGNKHTLPTDKLNANLTFALCYTEGAATLSDDGWTDSGLRLKTPKLTSLTYGSPVRVLKADSCFGDNTAVTLANCQTSIGGSAAHYNSILPRAMDVSVNYGGPEYGTGLAAGAWVSFVEQTQDLGGTGQPNNPCRDGNQASIAAAAAGSNDARLHSGVMQAASGTKTITIPQKHSVGGSLFNYLDVTKTFAVCYAETSGAANDATWRDSYIRLRFTKIKTLFASGVYVTTIGTFGVVPSLEVRWTGSLGPQQWLRFTSVDVNSGAPCDKSQAALTGSDTSTAKIQSGASSEMVTFDTSVLAKTSQNGQFFAVCYAETANADTADNSWTDSGIRLRFVKWTNSFKSRVATGAPVRLTFSINMGRFDRDRDKVVLLKGKTDCSSAAAAPLSSDGSNVARHLDYTCTSTSTAGLGSNCDSNFDGIYGETCAVGALCNPANAAANSGCGNTGKCEGTIQLPSGVSYNAIHDASVHTEQKLGEGFYAICLCLGTTSAAAHPASYNGAPGGGAALPPTGANLDGGCNTGQEFTRIFSPTVPGQTIKVISTPRLGRYLETAGQQTVRQISGMSQKYHIKATATTAGYQLANGDKVYFTPKNVGCGQATKYSGPGTHVWNYETNSYVSTGVNRRWRTIAKRVCTTVSGSNIGSNCDANGDGFYTETCVVNAFCNTANPNNGGCGSTGVCGSAIPAAHGADRTGVINVTEYSAGTLVGTVTTPSSLTTVQSLVACFATSEVLTAQATDNTDYVTLPDGLEVINTPRLGPKSSPGHVRALEYSSPSFTANTLKYGDVIYFVPKSQARPYAAPTSGDCIPTVCTLIGASNVGTNCDSDYNEVFDNTCVFRAKCNPSNSYNGGCGTGGKCEQQIPTVHTSSYTGIMNGSQFVSASGTGQVTLPTSPQLAVPVTMVHYKYAISWYLAACFIPAGAIQSLMMNVKPLQDMLTIFKEPTDVLVNSWFQYNVQELRFTQPQTGYDTVGRPDFSTGIKGDIIVLKKDTCSGVNTITSTDYMLGKTYSAKITLEEAGGETTGDEKGGTAGVMPLALGKVNELSPGIYKICYATKNSEGESQTDFKMLAKTLEILPPTATRAKLTVPRTVILGQDIVVHWESTIQLQTALSRPNSWIGLYNAKDCAESTEWRHECYKSFQFVEQDVTSGTVRFSQKDYKVAGEYDIRFFHGDTRNGQGKVCRGLTASPHGTYVQCVLEPAVTSSSIHIHGPDMKNLEDMDSQPGLEVVFAGNRGRFN